MEKTSCRDPNGQSGQGGKIEDKGKNVSGRFHGAFLIGSGDGWLARIGLLQDGQTSAYPCCPRTKSQCGHIETPSTWLISFLIRFIISFFRVFEDALPMVSGFEDSRRTFSNALFREKSKGNIKLF